MYSKGPSLLLRRHTKIFDNSKELPIEINVELKILIEEYYSYSHLYVDTMLRSGGCTVYQRNILPPSSGLGPEPSRSRQYTPQ
jgi:hypothetical protein